MAQPLLEFIIPTELNVLPMVPAGKSLSDMLLKDKNRRADGSTYEKALTFQRM